MIEPAVADFARYCQQLPDPRPCDVAVIFGSGLGRAFAVSGALAAFPYGANPVFPSVPGIPGQTGCLSVADHEGWRILSFHGRFHLYQGLSAYAACVPVRIAHALGCRKILLTSAIGGIHPALAPGDVLYITDHLNLTGDNPLRGLSGPPFVSLTDLYCRDLLGPLQRMAADRGQQLHDGVLAALSGPSYETPAEIRMLERLGADAVGMSLVPEAIMAKALGMEVVGLSLVTNRAAGLSGSSPSHGEVLTIAAQAEERFGKMCEELLRLWLI